MIAMTIRPGATTFVLREIAPPLWAPTTPAPAATPPPAAPPPVAGSVVLGGAVAESVAIAIGYRASKLIGATVYNDNVQTSLGEMVREQATGNSRADDQDIALNGLLQ